MRKAATETDLKAAYRRTAERDKRVDEAWHDTSREANAYLGEAPERSDEG